MRTQDRVLGSRDIYGVIEAEQRKRMLTEDRAGPGTDSHNIHREQTSGALNLFLS